MSEEIAKINDKLDKTSLCLQRIKELAFNIQIENLNENELKDLVEEIKDYIKELDKEI